MVQKKLKTILILGKTPPPYFGPAITTHILLNSKLSNYFNIIHLNTQVNKEITSLGSWNFSKVFRNIKLYLQLIKYLKHNSPDLVLIPISQTTTGFIKDSFFIIISSFFNTKILINFLGGEFTDFVNNTNLLTQKYIQFTLKKCSGVIVLGEKLKSLFTSYFPKKCIYSIPNGANYDIPIHLSNNEKIELIFIANLRKRKGIIETLQAIKILKDEISIPFQLNVVGSWQQDDIKEKSLNLIKKENLPVKIHSNISTEEKIHFLSKADIFIFPPNQPEGHPWVIVEAMSAGLPIISTNQGAITESVIHNKNGFIVDKNSPDQIAEKLKLLIENKELRDKMAQESKNHYLNGFTEDKMIERFVKCFNEVIQ